MSWRRRGLAVIAGLLFTLALIAVALVVHRDARAPGDAESRSAAIPHDVQSQRTRQFESIREVTTRELAQLDRRAQLAALQIVDLDPGLAPSATTLSPHDFNDRRQLLDPGSSPAEISRRERMTAFGVSERTLDAYTRVTEFDAGEIEALFRRGTSN